MGITLKDIAAQRAMLERGEEKRRAAKQAEERGRLRDTFAAAALTGIMASDDRGDAVARSWKLSGAMLREREQTNHDAVPEAKAASSPLMRKAPAIHPRSPTRSGRRLRCLPA